jgi:hypothetical protein
VVERIRHIEKIKWLQRDSNPWPICSIVLTNYATPKTVLCDCWKRRAERKSTLLQSETRINVHRPPLWSRGQSSWLQIQRSRFDSRRYQIFWAVVGLEPGPLSLVSTTEELQGRKSSDSSLENREYGHRDPSPWPRHPLAQKLALTSPTSVLFAPGLRPRILFLYKCSSSNTLA